jgi:hypothetical protein
MSTLASLPIPSKQDIELAMSSSFSPGLMTTLDGARFNPLVRTFPRIDIVDVARSLSRIPRFLGHTRRAYTVAEHCLHTSALVQRMFGGHMKQTALFALLHDGAEAYVNDLPSPIKHDRNMSAYAVSERETQERVWWELTAASPSANQRWVVKLVDSMMILQEHRDLRGGPDHTFLPPERIPLTLPPTDCELQQIFIDRYFDLTHDLAHCARA